MPDPLTRPEPACTGLLPRSLVVGDSERISSPLSLVTQCPPSLADGPNAKSRSRRRARDERSFRGNRRARAGEGAGRAIQAESGSRSKLVAGPSEKLTREERASERAGEPSTRLERGVRESRHGDEVRALLLNADYVLCRPESGKQREKEEESAT